jgi:hypothetical protein
MLYLQCKLTFLNDAHKAYKYLILLFTTIELSFQIYCFVEVI